MGNPEERSGPDEDPERQRRRATGGTPDFQPQSYGDLRLRASRRGRSS